jgi:hypothetical protein
MPDFLNASFDWVCLWRRMPAFRCLSPLNVELSYKRAAGHVAFAVPLGTGKWALTFHHTQPVTTLTDTTRAIAEIEI